MSGAPVLEERVTRLAGVGPAAARQLEVLGVVTVRDLLEHYPRRYADAGEVVDLSQVEVGAPATLVGEVIDAQVRALAPKGGGRGRRDLAELVVRQAGGAVFRVTFFNQRWMAERLAPGTVAAFSGKVGEFRGQLQLAAPKVEVLGHVRAGRSAEDVAEELRHQRLLPIYPAGGALTMLAFWTREMFSGHPSHPYAGILLFMILPGLFQGGTKFKIKSGVEQLRLLLGEAFDFTNIEPLAQHALRQAARIRRGEDRARMS
jgi:hypothetical protein